MTSKEEQEMVSSELLHMLEDVANREIPCQVAYAYIQKRLAASHAEGVEEGMDKLGEKCADAFNEGVQDTVEDLDLVTDAEAFARGRAEGAELEAAKIVHCTECVGGNDDTPEKDQCALWTDNGNAYCSSGTRDLSEWLNSLRDSVNDEINGEDVDPTPD